jgi:two-component system chemotaxis response regulator CheB
MPGIVIVQHMPETFTASFAKRLDSLCRVRQIEAAQRAHPARHRLPGAGPFAPAGAPLGGHFLTELSRGEPVNRHRPSVTCCSTRWPSGRRRPRGDPDRHGQGRRPGMLAMHRAGAWNIAQDQASCVVYGMPREAAEIGALDEVASLGDISGILLAKLRALDKRAGG